jgi:hypothetical protein
MAPDRTGRWIIAASSPLLLMMGEGKRFFGSSLVAGLGVLRRRGDLLIFSF